MAKSKDSKEIPAYTKGIRLKELSMTIAEQKYQELKAKPSDVNEQFDTIRKYVAKGDIVVELGVREIVSSWALLANNPACLISCDVVDPPKENLDLIMKAAKEIGTEYHFALGESTNLEVNPYIDVLFIDTLHLYSQIVKELWRFSEKTRKYIIFHDSIIPEVRSCIQDFLFNTNWKFVEEHPSGTKLCVLKRV